MLETLRLARQILMDNWNNCAHWGSGYYTSSAIIQDGPCLYDRLLDQKGRIGTDAAIKTITQQLNLVEDPTVLTFSHPFFGVWNEPEGKERILTAIERAIAKEEEKVVPQPEGSDPRQVAPELELVPVT